MLHIISLVLPVFIVLAVGNILKKVEIIDDRFVTTSNVIIFKVTMPALLFSSISKAHFDSVFDWRLVVILYVSTLIVAVLSFVAAKIMRLSKPDTGAIMVNSFRGNYANMALPVFFYVYGAEGITYTGVLLAFIVPFASAVAILVLSMLAGDIKNIGLLIFKSVFNPLTIGCMFGLLFSLTSIPLPLFIENSLGIVGDVTLPLALFCLGSSITLKAMKSDFVLTTLSSVLKMVICPAIGFLILQLCGIEMNMSAKAMIIILATPSGVANYVFITSMGGNGQLGANIIVATHCLSIVTFVMWLMIIGV